MENKDIRIFIDSIYKKLREYKLDKVWSGNAADTNILNDAYYFITGKLPEDNGCATCRIKTLNRVNLWLDGYESLELELEQETNIVTDIVTDKKNKKK